ncbi:prolyl 3-hydroxylase 3 [Lates japonicus]|uniref:Prolyl 3-hydroxylase 3 n=1 Tax=Lates japonicus TaxID=270547 RepID=A0AAD3MXY2_LATJO|nr:prolyl 3-hydroxylase 3 [Lates japonicus]
MAWLPDHFTVYVAFNFIILASLNVASTAPGGGSAHVLSLLQPYDFLYYSGVRAYFGQEWAKAAEQLEKSIVTKESLLRVRRQCHADCVAAGREALYKLDSEEGSLWDLWALDWVQQKAECLRFCIGRYITPAGQLAVSSDIEYEFGTRNPYNFLQVTYYKLEKLQRAASAAHTYFVANPSHLEMRNNIEKYRRMEGVTEEAFHDREIENEKHWVLYDAAVQYEASSDWVQAAEKWKSVCERNTAADGGVQGAVHPTWRISVGGSCLPTQLEHLHIAQFKVVILGKIVTITMSGNSEAGPIGVVLDGS